MIAWRYFFLCILFAQSNIIFSQTLAKEELCTAISLNEITDVLAEKLIIRKIVLNRKTIFDENDPEQQGTLYRWINDLHYLTEEGVILKDLLFKTGDRFNQEKIKESERLLRRKKYLWDANITAMKKCGNNIDLQVTTRDLWSLRPSVSFSRNGGENKKLLGLADSNFLGSGKAIEFARFENDERSGYLLNYQDPEIFKDHWLLNVNYAKSSDGFSQFMQLKRPFYALDSRWQAGALAANSKLNNQLYFRGEIVDEFLHRIKQFDVIAGTSEGVIDNQIFRLQYGLNYRQHRFTNITGAFTNSLLAEDRTLAYPWIGFEYIENDFLKLVNIKKIGKTEDINLGWRINLSAGFSSTALGADSNRWVMSSTASSYFVDPIDNLWSWIISFRANYADSQLEDAVISTGLRLYRRQTSWSSFYLSLDATLTENLYLDKQLTLGGDSGLRGYPLKYQTGDHRLLMKVEQRFYTTWEPWQLFNLGAAIFVDAGRAWFKDETNGNLDTGILHNVGIGLRLSPTRMSQNNVIHIDLAKPIGADGDVSGLQWLVSVKREF